MKNCHTAILTVEHMHERNMPKYHILKNSEFHNELDEEDDLTTTTSTHTIRTQAGNNLLADTDQLTHEHRQFKNLYCDDDDDDRNHQHNTSDIINNNNKSTFPNPNNLMTPLGSATCAAAADDDDASTMEIHLLQQSANNHHDESRSHNNNHLYEIKYDCLCQQKGFASNLKNNATRTARSKILLAIVLCSAFMVVEFLGGYIAGSLAIMTDAAHLASDCISFVIGLIAIWLGCKPPDAKMSFGYKRFEVMGAIVSILGIWILTATLVLVAIQRIYSNDYDLDANTMMTISGVGILINIIMIFILHTPMLDLPAGSIRASHGHCHSHSHNNHDGHSHSYSHNSASSYRRGSNDSGEHLHPEPGTRSLLPTASEVDADVGAGAATDAIDNGEATSIELSSASMMKPNGNLLQHQRSGNEKNLNLRAAMIHVIGDLVQSIGVFLAAILIKIFPRAAFLDPLCTLLFSVIVIMTTIGLFKESMQLVMDSVPAGFSLDDLEMDLLNIEGVKSVHHLNVWNHTSNFSILMVHLVIDIFTDSNSVLLKATHLAGSAKYNIKHSTIQIERVTS